jgi:hypothetical protein
MNITLENKIKNLIKQNDSIYNSIVAKKIEYQRININDDMEEEDKLSILQQENENLKNLSKKYKAPIEVKIKAPVDLKNSKKKENNKENENDEDEENYENPKKLFSTIINMEEIKRAFFNKDYYLFNELIKNINLKYYRASYRYESDKNG